MRIRRRPPPLPTAPPIDDPPQLPLSDLPPSLSAALYVDLLAPPVLPPSALPCTPPSSLPLASPSPSPLQPSERFPAPRLQLPISQSPPLLHEIEEAPRSADNSRCTPLSQPRAAAGAGKALEGCCRSIVPVEERCEEIGKPAALIPSAIGSTFAEEGENNEMRIPIRKRRSFTRPRCTPLPPSGTDGELQGSKAECFVALNELNRIGTWRAKNLLSLALQLTVPEEASQGVAGRIGKNGYSKSSMRDSIPRLVERASRCNPHVEELAENVGYAEDQTREQVLMRGGKWDHETLADRHTGRKQDSCCEKQNRESKVSFEENFVDDRITKRLIFSNQDEGMKSRTASDGMEVELKDVPTKCSREDGIINWKVERGGKNGNKLCGHQDFKPEQAARDGEADSSDETMKMKKKKKRRCFKSLHEIVKRDERRLLLQLQEGSHHQKNRTKLSSGSAPAGASDGGFWPGFLSFQSCVLNTDPTEWRSDLP